MITQLLSLILTLFLVVACNKEGSSSAIAFTKRLYNLNEDRCSYSRHQPVRDLEIGQPSEHG